MVTDIRNGSGKFGPMIDVKDEDPMTLDESVKNESAGETARSYYGKYRGVVVNNIDPMQIGRVIAEVPDVLGETPSGWAMPCMPVAGIQAGCFMVPPIGSQVWVEFEQGNKDKPIWTGGFWETVAEVPVMANNPMAVPPGQNIVLQTTGGAALVLSDAVGPWANGIVLKSASGATILVNNSGIFIDNGQGASIALEGAKIVFEPPLGG